MTGLPAAIVDIDGTLVDSNDQHALAWYRALRRFGVTAEVRRLHRLIGMGGDRRSPAPTSSASTATRSARPSRRSSAP